jgi:hypothetical protein
VGDTTNIEEEKEPSLQLVADRLAEQSRRATQESIRLIQERNRKENLERYGCDCPAAKCPSTCPKIMIAQESAVIFEYLIRTKPPDHREREVMPPGEPSYKSRSRSKRKRKKMPPLNKFYMET